MALIAEYGFNEGTGTTAADTSGNGYALTVTSGVWSTGHTGGAIIPTSTNPVTRTFGTGTLTAMTVMAWVKTPVSWGSGDDTNIFTDDDGDGSGWYFVISPDGRPGAWLQTGGPYAPSALPASTWVHVAWVVSGALVTIYVDGASVVSGSLGATLAAARSDLWAIGSAYSDVAKFPGTIDDFRLFDTALTSTDITTWMNTPVSSGGGTTITGTATLTTPKDSVGSSGTLTIPGTASGALPKDAVSALGVSSIPGGAALGLPIDKVSAAVALSITGSGALTLPHATAGSAGALSISGAVGIVLPMDIVAAMSTGSTITGTADIVLPGTKVSVLGTVTITGTAGLALGVVDVDAHGDVVTDAITGTANIVLPSIKVSALGSLSVQGGANVVLPGTQVAAQATFSIPGSADLTLPILRVSATDTVYIPWPDRLTLRSLEIDLSIVGEPSLTIVEVLPQS